MTFIIRRSWISLSLSLGLCLGLSGCIGSQILFDDNSPNDYGNLADVPEMMSPTPDQNAQHEQQRLEQDYKGMMKDHQDFSRNLLKKEPAHFR